MINRLRTVAAALRGFEADEPIPLGLDDADEAGRLLAAILGQLEELTEEASAALGDLVPHYVSGNRAVAARLRCSATAIHDASMRLYWAGVDVSRYRRLIQDVRHEQPAGRVTP